MKRSNNRRGFTLIELLVVVAIIALLAAILFPVFGRARENARRSACQSNMKQIGIGIHQYTQDYDERFPVQPQDQVSDFMNPAVASVAANMTYLNSIQPYLKSSQIYKCPSATPQTGVDAPTDWSDTSFFGNAMLFQPVTARHVAAIPSTASLVAIQEYAVSLNVCFVRPYVAAPGAYARWHHSNGGPEGYSNRHFEGGNLLYTDGHVKWKKYVAIRSGDFGLQPDEAWNTANSDAPSTGGFTAYSAAF